MRCIYLIRKSTSKFGTFGFLIFEDFRAFTCEPPSKNNQPRLSCIPKGEYEIIYYYSPHFGWVYTVKDVPNRSFILTHTGNVGGDTELGLKTDTLGCIVIGKYIGKVFGQTAVCLSRPTFRRFMEKAEKQKLKLIILEVY